MRRRRWSRALALLLALLGSLSAPTLALAHGRAHHDDHGDHDDHQATASTDTGDHAVLSAPGERHPHGHPRFDLAASRAEQLRLADLRPACAVIPPAVVITSAHPVPAQPRGNRADPARPESERGPPPALRAPPQR